MLKSRKFAFQLEDAMPKLRKLKQLRSESASSGYCSLQRENRQISTITNSSFEIDSGMLSQFTTAIKG